MQSRRNFAEHAKPITFEIEGMSIEALPCRFTRGVGWCRAQHVTVDDMGQELRPYLALDVNVQGTYAWPDDETPTLWPPRRDG
jgi:hypothetical protein